MYNKRNVYTERERIKIIIDGKSGKLAWLIRLLSYFIWHFSYRVSLRQKKRKKPTYQHQENLSAGKQKATKQKKKRRKSVVLFCGQQQRPIQDGHTMAQQRFTIIYLMLQITKINSTNLSCLSSFCPLNVPFSFTHHQWSKKIKTVEFFLYYVYLIGERQLMRKTDNIFPVLFTTIRPNGIRQYSLGPEYIFTIHIP